MSDLQHICRQGRRCKSRVRDDEGYKGGGVERPDSLCRPCEESATSALWHLADDYRSLNGALTMARVGADQGVYAKRQPGSPSLIRLDAESTMAAIEDEAIRWTLRITKGDPLPAMPSERVQRCVAILRANTAALVALPRQRVAALFPHPSGGDWQGAEELDGVDAVLRLAELHKRAQNVLGLDERVMWLPTKCHLCDLRAVAASADQLTVKCHGCRAVWSSEEFARLNNPLGYEEVS